MTFYRGTPRRVLILSISFASALTTLLACQNDNTTGSVEQAVCNASQPCPNGATVSCSNPNSTAVCSSGIDNLGIYVQCDSNTRVYCPGGCSCPTPSQFTYWVEPIGDTVDFGLNVCKPAQFTACDVTVTLTTQSIDALGNPITQQHNISIARSQTCNLKKFGHTYQQVLSVSVDANACSNCTVPCP